MAGPGGGVAFGIVFFLFTCLWIAALAYWIVALVEVARLPDAQFRATGSEKVSWVLVVALTGIIGALIWRFAKRGEVRAAPVPRWPAVPPGWYPIDASGTLVWWDGVRWHPGQQIAGPIGSRPQPPPSQP